MRKCPSWRWTEQYKIHAAHVLQVLMHSVVVEVNASSVLHKSRRSIVTRPSRQRVMQKIMSCFVFSPTQTRHRTPIHTKFISLLGAIVEYSTALSKLITAAKITLPAWSSITPSPDCDVQAPAWIGSRALRSIVLLREQCRVQHSSTPSFQ